MGLSLNRGSSLAPPLDAAAAAYQVATSMSKPAAQRLSNFLKGLTALGVRANFVDGWIMRADMQSGSGTTLYSVLGPISSGLGNLTLTGAPTRAKNGIQFNGTTQYANGFIPPTAGDMTIYGVSLRNFAAPQDANRSNYNFHRKQYKEAVAGGGYQGARSMWLRSESLNTILHLYNENGTGDIALGIGDINGSEWRYKPVVIRNDAAGTTISAHMMRSGIDYSHADDGTFPVDKLLVGAYTQAGTTIAEFFDGLVNVLLLFSKKLTTVEANGVSALVDQYINPKYRILTAGDSMSGPTYGFGMYVQDRGDFFGSNMDLVTTLSETDNMPVMVGKLITTVGGTLNSSQLLGGFPNILLTWFGHHEIEVWTAGNVATQAQASYDQMKQIWARAKSLGMKVVACTVNAMRNCVAVESTINAETKRRYVNTLMRADAGTGIFDFFLDTEAFYLTLTSTTLPAVGTTATDPSWYFNNSTYFDANGVHPTALGGRAITDQLSTLVKSIIP